LILDIVLFLIAVTKFVVESLVCSAFARSFRAAAQSHFMRIILLMDYQIRYI